MTEIIIIDGVETITPIQWSIPRVENHSEDGFHKTLENCDDSCHAPVHAFNHPERRKHLIEADLVKIARKNNWWNDVAEKVDNFETITV